jgi:hypothetical protein
LQRLGGEIVRASKLVNLEQRDEAGDLLATIDHDGTTEQISTRWVVGCDGVHSVTRKLAGIELLGHDITEPWAVFDATLTGWPHSYEANYAYLDEIPVIITSLPQRRWRVYLRPNAAETDLVAAAWRTIRCYLPAISFDNVTHPTRFHCHTKVAERYRSNRILLAGDAAHVCSPSQGHGMNSGLQDAFNLAWKLALVYQGHSTPALLDSYEAERRPVAEMITKSGDEFERAQDLTDPGQRRARDKQMRAAFADPKSKHHESIAEAELDIDYSGSPIVMGDHHDALAPGHRLPDTVEVRLPTGDARLLHELTHRAGHTALILGGLSTPNEEFAQLESSVREAHVAKANDEVGKALLIETSVALTSRADAQHSDGRLTPEAAARLGIGQATLLVIRPDGHVGLRADRDHLQALKVYQTLLASG